MLDEIPVIVRQLPETVNSRESRAFFGEVQKLLMVPHSRVVFDFAEVRELDAAGVKMLLQCLEEVMKRNGDLKLAAVPHGPAMVLETTGVDHLFEIFDNTVDAAHSFDSFSFPLAEEPAAVPLYTSPAGLDRTIGTGFAAD
jgi:anti-anti-sigma regulatory factor